MKTFIDLLIWSSKNPKKISLSIRAGAGFIASILALMYIPIDITPIVDQADLLSQQIIEAVNQFILLINMLVVIWTGALTMWGLMRKAYLTWKGENKVLK